MSTKLNKKEAKVILDKYLSLPKIGQSVNARRLEIIFGLLNEDGEANLQSVANEAFEDAKDPLNALATMAKDIEEKAKEQGFTLRISRDNFKKANLNDRKLWIEGDNIKKEMVLEESLASIGQPESKIENRARILNQFTIVLCFAAKEQGEVKKLSSELKDNLNLTRNYKFEIKNFNDVLPGDNRSLKMNDTIASADLLLFFESPAFYNDKEVREYILENPKSSYSDKICCVGLASLGNNPERRICEDREIFQWADKESIRKNYNELVGTNKTAFIQELAHKIVEKIKALEVDSERLEHRKYQLHDDRLTKLDENIPLDHSNFIPTIAKKESMVRLSERKEINKNEKREEGKKALELLDEWTKPDNTTTLFALLGQYGMGKTFTSKVFAKQQIERYRRGESKLIPIYFDLRDFDHRILNQTGFDIWSIIDAILQKRKSADDASPLGAEDIRDIWKSNDTLLIFDGLDEVTAHIGDSQVEAFFLNEIFKLIPDYRSKVPKQKGSGHKRKMLLTCRTDYFKSITEQSSFFQAQNRAHIDPKEDYTCAILLPFTEDQIKEYFRQVFKDKNPDRLYATLSEVHNLAELSQRPVLLNFLGEIIEDIEAIALEETFVTTATVYDRVVHKSFDRDKAKHEIPVEIKVKVLEEIAAFLWRRTSRRIEFSKLAEFMSEYLANGTAAMKKLYNNKQEEALYKDLRNATLLVRNNEQDFGFSHTSVQEYFLAKYIVDKLQKGQFEGLELKDINAETIDFVLDMFAAMDAYEVAALQTNFNRAFEQDALLLCRTCLFQLYVADLKRNRRLARPPYFNLTGLRIENLSLKGTPQQPIDLSGVIMKNTVLENCRWDYVAMPKADMRGMSMYMIRFEHIDMTAANLSGATLRGKWRNMSLNGVQTDSSTDFTYVEISCTDSQFSSPLINPHILYQSALKTDVLKGHTSIANYCVSLAGNRALSCSYDGSMIVWDLLSGKPIHKLEGHTDIVNHCVGLEGDRVLSCSDDNSLILWDLLSGKPIHKLEGHTEGVNHCVGLEGNQALSCSDDNSLILWDLLSGKPIHKLEGNTEGVNHCVGLEGNRALSCSDDNSLILWDLLSGKPIHKLEGHTDIVNHCVGLEGERALSCSDDGSLILWDLLSGKPIHKLEGHTEGVNHCVGLEGNRALSCSDDGSLIVWDLPSGKPIHKLEGHTGDINYCVALEGDRALSCGWDKSLILWDIYSGRLIEDIRSNNLRRLGWFIHCVGLEGDRALSCSDDGSLIVWDLPSGKPIHKLEGHTEGVNQCIALEGNRVMSYSKSDMLFLWDCVSGKFIHHLKGHSRNITFCVGLQGNRALSCSSDNSLILWDLGSGTPIHILEGHTKFVSHCIVLEGERALSCSGDGSMILWDLIMGKPIHYFKGHTRKVNYCIKLKGERVLSCSDDKRMIIWDLTSGMPIFQLTSKKSPIIHCVVLESEQLLSCNRDTSLILWDLNSGKSIYHLKGHTENVTYCVALEGNRALSCSWDKSLILWDLLSGEPIHKLEGHTRNVTYCIALEGNRALSCSWDNSLILWDLNSGKAIRQLKGHTGIVTYCVALEGERALSCSNDGSMILWDLVSGKAENVFYHLLEQGYASINAEGKLLDYSPNAWEHIRWVTEDEKGNKQYLHFDEVILEDT